MWKLEERRLAVDAIGGNWTSLFDGKTLDGWESDRQNVWWRVAEDGTLEGKSPTGDERNRRGRGVRKALKRYLLSQQSFGNFSLRFEHTRDIGTKTNLPLVFRASNKGTGNTASPLGSQYEFHFPGGRYSARDRQAASLFTESRIGEPFELIKRASDEARQLVSESDNGSDWNSAEITVRGKRVVVTVNGIEMLNTTVDRIDPGQIGFVAPTKGVVKIRNVRIRELSPNGQSVPAAPVKENPAERAAAEDLQQRPAVSITVKVRGEQMAIKPGEQLPAEPFTVIAARLRDQTDLTDKDMANVARFASLNKLILYNLQLTDGMLRHIGGMRSLRQLRFKAVKFGKNGLSELSGLTQLTHLGFLGSQMSDGDLRHLSGMQTLIWLNLRITNVTGNNLEALAGLKELRTLAVGGTKFTEKSAALTSLKKMTQLTRFGIYGGLTLTDQEKADLRAALPKCTMEFRAATSEDDLEDDADDVTPKNE